MRASTQRSHKPFRADILVYDPTGTKAELVVELKRSVQDTHRGSAQLRSYMLRTNCHNGLLVTPEHMYVYRDTFDSSTPEAIVLAGRLPTKRVLGEIAEGRNLVQERQLASAVVAWLRTLTENWYDWLAARPDEADLVDALLPHFLMALSQGRIVSDVAGRLG